MRVLLQRVTEASVEVEGRTKGAIGKGILVLLGIEAADTEADIAWLVGKISRLRIFDDEQGVMNLDVQQVGGRVLVVSQFTLHASTKKGNRPSYIKAAPEAVARPLYNRFIEVLSQTLGQEVPSGEFGADMAVKLCNDGPVTIWIDSQNRE
ncbi:MAG: D-tyrosyl-tRNA(Tyr) deacylase [Rikenellaceae bacterium]|nr:D-tyrosyl-tRNA(Tyr) deacylase [Rikenellaceae bacterium]